MLNNIRIIDGIQFQLKRCKEILAKGPDFTRKVFRAFQNPELRFNPETNTYEERDPYLLVTVHTAVLEEHLKVMIQETEQFPDLFENYTVIPTEDIHTIFSYGIPRGSLNLILSRLIRLKEDLKNLGTKTYNERIEHYKFKPIDNPDIHPEGEKSSWFSEFKQTYLKQRNILISETKVPEYDDSDNAWTQMVRCMRNAFTEIANENRISHSRYDTKVCWIIDHLSVRLEFLLFNEAEIDEMLSRPQEKQRGYAQELPSNKPLLSSDYNLEDYENYYSAINRAIASLD
jgi:hypothetical protein